MAARALKDLDAAVPPLTRSLTLEIRTVHQSAGSPSFTHLDSRNVRAGRGTLAKATLSRILTPDPAAKDQSLPGWSYYEGLLCALDVDPAPFQPRWQAAQEEWQARARGESSTLPAVREQVSAVPAVLPSAAELEPRTESGLVTQHQPAVEVRPMPVPAPRHRRRSLLVLASIVGTAAVVIPVGAFAFVGRSHSQPPRQQTQAQAMKPMQSPVTAVLVTNAPPKTLAGKIVRTWNQDANNGHGGSIGVLVFPTPFALNGSEGPRHDGDVVEVVCHTTQGRLTHERLDAGHENSTGWFQIYYQDRLWWVADHYISLPHGVQAPDCAS
ncbi:hypothetical protein [Catenulispora pinisilvae]|uniref:hypothetical protein n=1 Tax=Catenulispora pinisilvae TaxID=2705253 RepID=UPI00189178D7|nr:hypothetical protein [Catenulispora pinisilvae]